MGGDIVSQGRIRAFTVPGINVKGTDVNLSVLPFVITKLAIGQFCICVFDVYFASVSVHSAFLHLPFESIAFIHVEFDVC